MADSSATDHTDESITSESLDPDAHRLDPIGVGLVLLSTIGFSTLTIFGKLAYAELSPLSTLAWRLGGAAIAIWVGLLWRQSWQIPRRQALSVFGLGAVGYALQSALLFHALNHASAGVTAVLFFTYPMFVALFSWLINHKPLGLWRAIALGLATVGCILTIDFQQVAIATPLGISLGLASGLTYALYLMISARFVQTIDPVTAAGYLLLGATVTIAGWAGVTQGLQVPQSSLTMLAVVGLGLVSTALPISCLFAGLRRLDVLPTSILSTLEPLLAIAMATLWLREPLGLQQLAGSGLIILASLLVQLQRR